MERDPSPPHPAGPRRPTIVIQEPTPPESAGAAGRKQTRKHDEDKLKEPSKKPDQKHRSYHAATEAAHPSATQDNDKNNDKGKGKEDIDATNNDNDQEPRRHLRYHITHQHHYHIHHHHYHTNYLPGTDVPQRRRSETKHQWYAPPPGYRDMHGYVQMPSRQGAPVQSKDPHAPPPAQQQHEVRAHDYGYEHDHDHDHDYHQTATQHQVRDAEKQATYAVPQRRKSGKGSRHREAYSRYAPAVAAVAAATQNKDAPKLHPKAQMYEAQERQGKEHLDDQTYRRHHHQTMRSYPDASKLAHGSSQRQSQSQSQRRRSAPIPIPQVAHDFNAVSGLAARRAHKKHRGFGERERGHGREHEHGHGREYEYGYKKRRHSYSPPSVASVCPDESISQIRGGRADKGMGKKKGKKEKGKGGKGEGESEGSQSKLKSKLRK
ncbi:uncharacterized protein F4807DRAFT_436339 [Annulohypoxylon truncatum]|uniref:uncharacterized protein n=1 Tax=Annulohypoxylon truncatum TaxID=327061 RepID=UPI002007740A|nr:uncharacterized protein F4807DRAFT_436339 [Annulohypoxylon truncatum]KAI1207249.1 hypothetical protein F4807DRAFT_436339 [Annulohypoxylon truncatum]